jgi:hypothetical protein
MAGDGSGRAKRAARRGRIVRGCRRGKQAATPAWERALPSRPGRLMGTAMLKILLWIIVIIFLIGLLVVTGIIDLIF